MMYLLMIALVVSPSTSAHPAWMVGTWSWRNPGEHGSDCNSDHNITYHRTVAMTSWMKPDAGELPETV